MKYSIFKVAVDDKKKKDRLDANVNLLHLGLGDDVRNDT